MKSVKFIINATTKYAGNFSKHETIAFLGEHFQLSFESTSTTRSASDIAKSAVNGMFDIIVAVGGNGTLYEITQAICNEDIPIGYIPTGYASTLAKNLSLPSNLKDALKVILDGKVKEIDLIQVKNKKSTYYAINYVGLALSANVVERLNQNFSNTFQKYWSSLLKSISHYNRKELNISFDNVSQQINPLTFLISNVPIITAKRTILPEAKMNDGIANVLHIEHHFNQRILFAFKNFFLNSSKLKNYAQYYAIQKMTILPKETIPVQIDLELFYMNDEIEIEVLPKALKVFVP